MPRSNTIVSGHVRGFWVSDRDLMVKVRVAQGEHVVLRVEGSRFDFGAQLDIVKYALGTNEEQEVRSANGLERLPHKVLWARLTSPLPPDLRGPSGRGEPPVARAEALGLAEGDVNPFDLTLAGF